MKPLKHVKESIFEIDYTRSEFNVREKNFSVFPTSDQLLEMFEERVSKAGLVETEDEFKENIERLESIHRFRWNHDMVIADYHTTEHTKSESGSTFGGFRYVNQIAFFKDYLGWDMELEGKTVLDVGPWSGSSSVIYNELGAEVDAVEEGPRQVEIIKLFRDSFGVPLNVIEDTLYRIDSKNKYDLISNFGVLYHVTDPLLFLRICYNALKDNGVLLLETMSTNDRPNESFMRYQGSFVDGANWFVPNRISLLRLLKDAGFVNIKVASILDDEAFGRTFAIASKRDAGDPWEPLKLGWAMDID